MFFVVVCLTGFNHTELTENNMCFIMVIPHLYEWLQQSIPGPSLYLIYVNDLATVCEHTFSIYPCMVKNIQLLENKSNAENGERF